MHGAYVWLAALCLALLAAAPLAANAQGSAGATDQNANEDAKVQALDKRMDRLEPQIKRGSRSEDLLKRWAREVNEVKAGAAECVSTTDESLQGVSADIKSLGPPVKSEAADVTRKRRTLAAQQDALEKRLANCRLLLLRTDDAITSISQQQKDLLAQRLLTRGPSFIALLKDNWQQPAAWLTSTKTFLLMNSGLSDVEAYQLGILGAILVVVGLFAYALRRRALAWVERRQWDRNFSSRFNRALVTTFGHYAPHLLLSGAAAIFFLAVTNDVSPVPFISVVAYGLPVYFLLVTLIHLFLAPCPPGRPFLDYPTHTAKQLARRLKVFVLLAFLGYLLFSTILAQSLPAPALLLARGVFAAIFILNLAWAVWLFGRMPGLAGTRWLRAGLYLVLLATLVTEWLGYRNLSVTILRAVVGTLFALGMLVLFSRLLAEMFDGLDRGRRRWQRALRSVLGLKSGDHFPGLVWLRVTTTVSLWAAFALAALRLWGISETALQQVQGWLIDGFAVGSLKIVPERILLAVIAFALLFTLTGWFRTRLERKWILKTHMDRGAREAVVTMAGYIGIGVALLVGLGVTGVDFSHLAIIAGALSVGIGFGLQNIVNNFVSGLILLFERPIKTGDWIVVGGTEGYVKRIRIRSTQIQTFDRADVIVPNSELISSQVTNWMLYDARGRARVAVGVAYGSDTAKVNEILLDIANKHPSVITDGSAPKPMVLFREFGDSSLNFELRCHIQNIDERLSFISEVNFAIDAAFREHGVEIPFPQRDLHVRDVNMPESRRPNPEPGPEPGEAST
ncbi:MAG TPA: mechanosensitive ion channel domain-containing protein [Gammaproteobacteria bacterium]|nr:mechanosensitive ion channel domain-containing protein [Gammaproteobacteria bacterium]